jgi:hypothetical protein
MIFTKEPDGSYSGILKNQVYQGMMHEELYYCDIDKAVKGYTVRWQDDYSNGVDFAELGDAKQYVVLEYYKHTPHSNGTKWEIEDE